MEPKRNVRFFELRRSGGVWFHKPCRSGAARNTDSRQAFKSRGPEVARKVGWGVRLSDCVEASDRDGHVRVVEHHVDHQHRANGECQKPSEPVGEEGTLPTVLIVRIVVEGGDSGGQRFHSAVVALGFSEVKIR